MGIDGGLFDRIVHWETVLMNKKGTLEFLADLISDDFLEINYKGQQIYKPDVIPWLEMADLHEWVGSQFKGQLLSPDLFLLTYLSQLQLTPDSKKTVRSSLWRNEGNKWRLVFHQETRL
ncbi:DUF4440 domain-containing protein [Legionella shakespearei]|uniref:DUF4440 domain-containing protein n=1 Tax=Legionella shakespearei DSM 23087 TaxID=1122169 RepID=A0A0W0ZA06_9GAMM|nr:DUF4440 domain-containing protein [Legionella shakespearei]KTD65954.1 hypothetical protein Lsha_0161 [Legionella shakespearei DSM 23087]